MESSPAQDHYDLVLTDIRITKMNGFDLYRKLREKNASIPIAVLTAFETNQDEFSKVMPRIGLGDFIKNR